MNAPGITVIVEWENTLLAEHERCARMLRRLRHQVLDHASGVEILVLFNPGQVAGQIVRQAVSQHLLAPDDGDGRLACRIIPGEGLHYYDLKNLGAKAARGEVVAFIDSDVIPDEGWLRELTRPLRENPGLAVVAGNTYLDPDSLVSRAFALGWFFPLRRMDSGLIETGRFFANNVAFRRNVLAQRPFPEMAPGQTRGACTQLAKRLHREGMAIWLAPAAQTRHPAPNGLGHLLSRGLAEGRDLALSRLQSRGRPPWRTALKATRQVLSRTWRMLLTTLQHHRTVGLPLWQAPLAVSIMTVYYLEICAGAWACALAPGKAVEWWRI